MSGSDHARAKRIKLKHMLNIFLSQMTHFQPD